jgi:hypothetical protein
MGDGATEQGEDECARREQARGGAMEDGHDDSPYCGTAAGTIRG